MRAVNHIRYMDVMPQSERNLNYPVSLNYAFSLCFLRSAYFLVTAHILLYLYTVFIFFWFCVINGVVMVTTISDNVENRLRELYGVARDAR